jgi:cystathionine gamma-synthase/methionine-gamma-lyase
MKIETKVVHAGDRPTDPDAPGAFVPVTMPISTASSYFYESTAKLDRVLGQEEEGFCYARYGSPTNAALEQLVTSLENGAGALACASGMAAVHIAILAALTDRRKSIVAASALYGANTSLLYKVLEPLGVEVRSVDICDLEQVRQAINETKPGCVFMETISNPLLRVGALDRIAEATRAAGAALVVDNTFASPMLVRPLDLGAHLVVHSLTKFLAGHGDVLGGVVIADEEHYPRLRSLSRIMGPVLGPFESYLTMRGIKTFALRMERQCSNACRIASWLRSHPGISQVHYLADPAHPDAPVIRRLLPEGLSGAIVSFELKNACKEDVFRFMDSLKLVVRGTSLGDVHSLMLYPLISSHRDLAPKQRERLGIGDGLVRLCAGIEAPEDIIGDLEQALAHRCQEPA